MPWLRRVAPALLLLVLAPIVAEFLLGDFSVRSLWLLPLFLPQYGGGALLIREVTRRAGRGWPTMVTLAVAYALIEEGFTTQSLFNPDYLGQRLLDYGYVPALGTSPVWAVFVVSIHVVWSISTPILIAEGVAGARRITPWLGRIGLAVVAVLFVLGCVLTTLVTLSQDPFVAPAPRLAMVAVLVVAAVAVAFLAFRPGPGRRRGSAPSPWLVGLAALALATGFELAWDVLGHRLHLPGAITALAMLACAAIAVAVFATWSRGEGWGPLHDLGVATATVLTYAWVGLSAFLGGRTRVGVRTDAIDDVFQVLLILVVLGLIVWGMARSRAASSPETEPPGRRV